jgi:hypothetical protein
MFCDIASLDGTPFEGDPRQVLRRNLERARNKGFTFYVAPDMEFFYFANSDPRARPEPLDSAGYFDLTTADVAGDIRKKTIHTLEAMGIPVEYSHHEDAPSQHEIDLRYTDALTMADNVMTFRLVVKEVAHELGVHATFMPKPLEEVQGSGMHTHFSLFEGDTNAFHDSGDEHGLSKIGRASSPASCSTPVRSRLSPTSTSTPTSVSSPASKRRSTSPGRATTGRSSSMCPTRRRARPTARGSSSVHQIRPATLTLRSRWFWRPA